MKQDRTFVTRTCEGSMYQNGCLLESIFRNIHSFADVATIGDDSMAPQVSEENTKRRMNVREREFRQQVYTITPGSNSPEIQCLLHIKAYFKNILLHEDVLLYIALSSLLRSMLFMPAEFDQSSPTMLTFP